MPLGRSAQTQFLHPRCKRARLDPQQLGGSAAAVHFPARFVQRRQNVGALGITQFLLRAYLNDCRIADAFSTLAWHRGPKAARRRSGRRAQ